MILYRNPENREGIRDCLQESRKVVRKAEKFTGIQKTLKESGKAGKNL